MCVFPPGLVLRSGVERVLSPPLSPADWTTSQSAPGLFVLQLIQPQLRSLSPADRLLDTAVCTAGAGGSVASAASTARPHTQHSEQLGITENRIVFLLSVVSNPGQFSSRLKIKFGVIFADMSRAAPREAGAWETEHCCISTWRKESCKVKRRRKTGKSLKFVYCYILHQSSTSAQIAFNIVTEAQ